MSKILEGNRFIDKVLFYEDYKDFQFRVVKRIYRRRSNLNGLNNWLKFSCVNNLKREHYDAVINLHEILDAMMFSEMSGAKTVVNVPLINDISKVNRNVTLESLATLRQLDKSFDEEVFAETPIDYGWGFTDNELDKTNAILQRSGCDSNGYIVFVLGTTWESKNYPIENWVGLTELLSQSGKKIVCVGDDKDKIVLNQIRSKTDTKCFIDLIGKTSLREMIMVLSKAGVVIGGDIGPLHMAASFNVNTVTLMNPTSVEKFAPLNTKDIVLTADYDCKDCHKVKCPKGICCMAYISPENVYKAVSSML